jgi:hypothetical protein
MNLQINILYASLLCGMCSVYWALREQVDLAVNKRKGE